MKRIFTRLPARHCGRGLRSGSASLLQQHLPTCSAPIITSRANHQTVVLALRSLGLSTDSRSLLNPQQDLASNRRMRDVPTGSLSQLQRLLGLDDEMALPIALQDAVLLCFDCEAYESDQSKVTEVGISCIDTCNIRSIPPGSNGEPWLPLIQSSHYRIEEYRHLRNGRFSKGNPDSFAFGESAGLALADASAVLRSSIENGGLSVAPAEPRNVIIVGHSLKSDLAYLRQLGGLEVLEISNVVLRFDTQLIATQMKQKPGLAKLLAALEIEAKHLHNAGNDAYYTLHALLSMAVKERQSPGSVQASLLQSTRPPKKRYAPQRPSNKKSAQPLQDFDTGASSPSALSNQASAGAAAGGDDNDLHDTLVKANK